jgi:hypothetical protein
MRIVSVLSLALVALTSPTPSAQAVAETCMGQSATIVGSPGGSVVGTVDGDVIVTHGARSVSAGSGDDLVCITGSTPDGKHVQADTGAGDDLVEVHSSNTVRAQLGEGADSFTGGAEDDHVRAGYRDAEYGDHVDEERDIVSTGDGDDSLSSGQDSNLPDPDLISLGSGDDNLVMAGSGGSADGGTGINGLIVQTDGPGTSAPGRWVLDNVQQQLAKNGEVRFTWTGFQRFELHWLAKGHPLSVIGSDQDEIFMGSSRGTDTRRLEVAAGGGDDIVAIGTGVTRQVLDGGPGHDTVSAIAGASVDRLRVDLGHHRLRRGSDRTRSTLRRFEDVTVTGFRHAFVRGDVRRNRIDLSQTCHAEIRGAGGADRLRVVKAPTLCGRPTPPRLDGGPGDDLLIGSRLADILLGGPGHDVARGAAGRDRCVAEVRVDCELR